MNSRFLTFIIGVLTGAIIMTLIFLFVIPSNVGGQVPPGGFSGQPPEPPNGENMGQPPMLPNGEMPPQQAQ